MEAPKRVAAAFSARSVGPRLRALGAPERWFGPRAPARRGRQPTNGYTPVIRLYLVENKPCRTVDQIGVQPSRSRADTSV